jgi:hypothetical protein
VFFHQQFLPLPFIIPFLKLQIMTWWTSKEQQRNDIRRKGVLQKWRTCLKVFNL